MPLVLPYQLWKKFQNLADFNEFKNSIPDFRVRHTKYSTCTMCEKNKNSHKMKIQYNYCINQDCNKFDACKKEYKTTICMKSEDANFRKHFFYQIGVHNSIQLHKEKPRGISTQTKDVIEEIIHEFDCKPKNIHLKLLKPLYKSRIDIYPDLSQIQNYIKYRRYKMGDNNRIDDLNEYVRGLKYIEGATEENQLFTFGNEIGDGTDEDHFHLGFTSLKLLKNINIFVNKGCYHIDATYKIVKYSYPLIVFGFSDQQRQFYPLAFMFTSHEQEADYNHFLGNFKRLCNQFDINFQPKFIVSDASKAISNAIKSSLPGCVQLMCWMHLKMNVRKHKNLIPDALYKETLNQLNKLHMCQCEASFKILLKLTLAKWFKSDMTKFSDYFTKQWVNSNFKNWMIFLTPAGYAHTNNPVENYNCIIKSCFTNRVKFNILPAVEKFQEVIAYESNKVRVMNLEGKVTKAIKLHAKEIINNNKLQLNGGNYNYLHLNGAVFTIDFHNKTCTCDRFLDKAVCKHLTAACMIENIELNGLHIKSKTFVTRRRIKKNKISDSDDEAHTEVVEPIRGRPANAEKALEIEKPQKKKKLIVQSDRVLRKRM